MNHSRIQLAAALGRPTIQTILTAIAVSAVLVALFFVATYESLGRGGQGRVAEAFASGDLADGNYRRGDAVRGLHQYNDCLILSMALDQRQPRRLLTISPTAPGNDPNLCMSLKKQDPRFFYHNYLHGQVTLVRYLLPFLSIAQIRELYRLAISLVLGAGIALSVMRLAQGDRMRQSTVALIVLLTFSRAFGLEVFGQSLGHGPSDFILVAFVAYLALGRGNQAAIVAASAFGSLTMIFELLTGGLPIGLAAIFGLLSFRGIRTATLAAIAFSSAAVATFAIKLATVAYVFGGLAFLDSLAIRMVGSVPPNALTQSFPRAIAGNTEALMPGLGVLAGLILLCAIGGGLWALLRRPSPEIRILALSNVPIFAWPIVFHEHMIVHAWFMDRIFVWPIASGLSMIFLAVYSGMPSPGDDHHDSVAPSSALTLR